ncbi:MAG TPA: glycosyltransferase 87 family protein [Pseudonocardiaceae bacterium]|jgi:alpha-1,2-mannosyltransferase|nr:glycosyltransferase 87 family protein [Pseudonocardiaceae bacterium]
MTRPGVWRGSQATRAGLVLRRASIILAALVAAVAVLFWLTGRPLGLDSSVYRAGALAVLHGRPLYTTLPFLPSWATGMPFTYPPVAALVFVPLAWLPAQLFWGALAVASILVLGLVLATGIGARANRWPTAAIVAVGAGSLALEPVWRGIGFGQIDALLMAMVVLDVVVLPASPRRGVLIGLAAAIKLTPLVFVLHLFITGRRTDALRALGTFAGLTTLSLIVLPADSIRYWSTQVLGGPLFGTNPATSSAQVADQSLNGLIERLSDRAGWAFPAAVLLGLALLAVVVPVVRRLAARGARLEALLVSAGYGLLVSPISWTHHWVWVVPLFGLLVARAVASGRFWWLAAFCAVFTGWFQLAVPHGDNDELRWTFPQSIVGNAYVLAALVVVLLLYWRIGRAPRPTDRISEPAEGIEGVPTAP